jgi:hypothetical protein
MRFFDSMIVKTVEPYITIMSPFRTTPTLSASAAASMVPAITGVPLASPVARAALAVTWPATAVVHMIFGSRSMSTMPGASSVLHRCSSTT